MELDVAVDDPRAADVQALLDAHLTFSHKVTPAGHVHALATAGLLDSSVTFFSARRDGVVVGVGALRRIDALHAEIKSMHVDQRCRGQGVGRAIVEHLLEMARAAGVERVSLETGTMDAFAPARALYAAMGFTRCEPFGEYTDNPRSVCMTKVLPQEANRSRADAISHDTMPRTLVDAAAAASDGRSEWLPRLPETISRLAQRWSLEVGEPFQPGGQTAWVAPARTSAGAEVVLKVGWRHDEAIHEPDALRLWNGNGAVQLYDAADFDDTIALLIERCVPGTSLKSLPEPEQDIVIAGLLRQLWRTPTPTDRFRPLQVMCDAWADEFEKRSSMAPGGIDPGLAREGIALFRALPASAEKNVLLCTDLHEGNILAAQREPWLVVDPKPYVGDPTYDALQHLLSCRRRLHAEPDVFMNRMAELLDLDVPRLRLWLFARCMQESHDWPDLAEVARRIAPA